MKSLFTFLVMVCLIQYNQIIAQANESFDNSPAGSAYSDASFTGDDGFLWSYVESRDENNDNNGSGIMGNALMLRRQSDGSKVTSALVPGGIGDFSVNLYKGFTGGGDRQVELFVNGVSRGTSVPFDNFMEQTFTVSDINVVGDVVVEIRNITGSQVIVDNISWTGFTVSGPVVGFDNPTNTFSEGDASNVVDVPITMDIAPAMDVIIDVVSADDTAEEGVDYVSISESVTFLTTDTYPITKNVQVTILGDTDIEPDESFNLGLTLNSGPATLSIDQSEIVIENDDFLPVPDVILNELLSDPGSVNDANQDGTSSSTQDEYVEFYNNEVTDLDISGYTLSDGSGVQFTFPAGTIIPAQSYFTVFGGGAADNVEGIAFVASGLSLNNGGDDILLEMADGTDVISETYSFSGNDEALARNPNLTGALVDHSSFNPGVTFSPNNDNSITRPSNDDCANAKVLATDQPNTLTGESFGDALIDDTCEGVNPGVWYNVNTNATGGDLIITVTPSGNADIVVSIDSDCNGTFDDCVNLAGPGMPETVTIVDPTNAQGGGSSSRLADLDYKILVSDAATPPELGTFDISASGTALPVTLVGFKAYKFSNNVSLRWITSSELNNEGFIIEHSTDGSTFSNLGKVQGAGTSNEDVEYSFAHTNVKTPINYYRLKQVDYDGRFEYSDIVMVEVETAVSLVPSTTIVRDHMQLLDKEQYELTVNIVNSTGQLIQSVRTQTNDVIDLSNLNPGVFFLNVEGRTFRIVKM